MNRRGFIGTIAALTALAKSKPEPVSPSFEKNRNAFLPDPSVIDHPLGEQQICRRWSNLYTPEISYSSLPKHKEDN